MVLHLVNVTNSTDSTTSNNPSLDIKEKLLTIGLIVILVLLLIISALLYVIIRYGNKRKKSKSFGMSLDHNTTTQLIQLHSNETDETNFDDNSLQLQNPYHLNSFNQLPSYQAPRV